jgi:hypothetical protein
MKNKKERKQMQFFMKLLYASINERKFDIKNLYLEHNQEILPENTCLVREKKKKEKKRKETD